MAEKAPKVEPKDQGILLFENKCFVLEGVHGADRPLDLSVLKESGVNSGDAVLQKFNKQTVIDILPLNCRMNFRFNGNHYFTLIELPPAMRTLKFNYDFSSEYNMLCSQNKDKEFGYKSAPSGITASFAMPWLCLGIVSTFNGKEYNFNTLYAFYRLSPITSMNDRIIIPNLMNISEDSRVCTGRIDGGTSESLTVLANSVVQSFFSNAFNRDIRWGYEKYAGDEKSNLGILSWAHYSKTNPMFIYEENWQFFDDTLGKHVQRLTRESSNRASFTSTLSMVIKEAIEHNAPKESLLLNEKLFSITDITGTRCNKLFYIGQQIKTKDGIFTISEFMKNGNLKLVNEDKTLTLTADQVYASIIETQKIESYEFTKVDGTTERICPGDALFITLVEGVTRIVQVIAILNDGTITKIVSERDTFAISADMCKKITSIFRADSTSIKYNDIDIEKGKHYLIYKETPEKPFITELLFDGIVESFTFNKDNGVILSNKTSSVTLGRSDNNIKILSGDAMPERVHKKVIAFQTKIFESNKYQDVYTVNGTLKLFIKTKEVGTNDKFNLAQVFDATKKSFFVESFIGKPIEFTVGDDVIVYNREAKKFNQPTKITDIKIDSSDGLTVVTADAIETQLVLQRRIDGANAFVQIGGIRKVNASHALAGAKVVSKNEANKIPPMKIHSIIVDSFTEIVLFTNGSTDYLAKIEENYNITIPTSSEYEALTIDDNAKNPVFDAIYPGDVIQYEDRNRTVYKVNKTKAFLFEINNNNTEKLTEISRKFTSSITMLSPIPNPRDEISVDYGAMYSDSRNNIVYFKL